MSTRFFGQFLLERGVITRDMLLDAIKHQKTINKPLCALAVEKGYLSQQQLQELDAEHRKSDRKFLEIAVRKEMLQFQQLEDLARAKSDRWVFLAEALVDKGYVNLVQLNQLFEEYRKVMSPAPTGPGPALAGIPEQEVVSALLDVTVDLFVHYTKQVVEVTSVARVSGEPDDVAYVFTQEVTGDKNFFYALALPEKLTLSIASYMLQEEQKEINSMALDAVSEFVNVVIGNGCTKLSLNDFKVHAKAPQIMTRDMVKRLLPADVIAVNMKTTRGDFRVLFFFESKPAA